MLKFLICLIQGTNLISGNLFETSPRCPLTVAYEWKILEYEYPSPRQEQADRKAGFCTPGNAFPTEVDVYYHCE